MGDARGRLEEELGRAHTEFESVHGMMTRKDSEIHCIREGAAHQRQRRRAVEARLELQERNERKFCFENIK